MDHYIRISEPAAGPSEPHRLNAYPGRHLSEREFELLQAYVDDRITPLLGALTPGIVQGLDVRAEGLGADTMLHILSGLAVNGAGNMVRLYYPLHQTWPELAALVTRAQDGPLTDGLYFLTLRPLVEAVDDTSSEAASTRTQIDPTRARRLETVILPGLQQVSVNPRLLAMPQDRAANRISVRFLQESAAALCGDAVPIALIKVLNGLPQWVDTLAGRFPADKEGAYRSLLAQVTAVMEERLAGDTPSDPTALLSDQLGLDYLPAAGRLPSTLLRNPSSKTPSLGFAPADLQVELAPAPASTISAVLAAELPRGAVDLVHGLGERIRLLLAIPDLDYRSDLLNLPQRDLALEDQLFQNEMAAANAWRDWAQQWQLLYQGLSDDQRRAYQVPTFYAQPRNADACRQSLVDSRRATMSNPQTPLPEPYASHLLAPHGNADYDAWKRQFTPPTAPNEQLLLQRENMLSALQQLEDDLADGYQLLNEMNDYLNLQRQQLDTLTLSFTALAGGVVGDGSGASMVRWNGSAKFDQTAAKSGA